MESSPSSSLPSKAIRSHPTTLLKGLVLLRHRTRGHSLRSTLRSTDEERRLGPSGKVRFEPATTVRPSCPSAVARSRGTATHLSRGLIRERHRSNGACAASCASIPLERVRTAHFSTTPRSTFGALSPLSASSTSHSTTRPSDFAGSDIMTRTSDPPGSRMAFGRGTGRAHRAHRELV